MSNKAYDTLKLVALILAPILAFAASIVNIWGVEHSEQIVASLTALDTLIGAIVVAASKMYHDDKQLEEETEEEEG